jgi:ABC-type dipeptide/oligopeptide/nickel transport system permease subunit
LGSDFIMNPRLLAIVIAVSVAFLPAIGRIMRGGVIAERNRQYVEAARVIGASETRVMFRHVLPNLLPLMIVLASTSLPAAILTEASLSYLGVGLPYGDASWGGDLGGSAKDLFTIAPWLAIFPGVALGLAVLAFNLLGDSLRDELDPRLRGSGLRG